MTKVQFLFDELAKVFESKKTPFTKPIELLENFGLFTKTNILHNGFLQAQQLKEFFLLEKSNYEIFINNFRKSFDLDAEKKTLDGQEVELLGKKIDPATLFKEKRFKLLNKARITTPKETKDLDKTLQEEILKVLPPIADPEIKEKITSYLMGEVKKLNPQPDQIFELSPEGQWFKVEATSEQKPKTETPEKAETPEKVKEQEKEKAKEEALKKAEEV
jgi:hypothetical protein